MRDDFFSRPCCHRTFGPIDKLTYQELLGFAIYVAYSTRSDIQTATTVLASACQNPTEIHMKALIHLIGYLKQTNDVKIKLGLNNDRTIHAFSDSDYTSNEITFRSCAGTCIFIMGTPVLCISKYIKTICKSTTEAEWYALDQTTHNAEWLLRLMKELQPNVKTDPIIFYVDNQSVIKANMSVEKDTKRLKHIDTKVSFMH